MSELQRGTITAERLSEGAITAETGAALSPPRHRRPPAAPPAGSQPPQRAPRAGHRQTRRNTNSPLVALVTLAWWAGCFAWLGWRGLVVAFASHIIGGIGYAINLRRHGRLR